MRRQQIIETVECDQCGEESDNAVTFTVEIGQAGSNGRPIRRTLDMCPEHATPIAELHETLRTIGRTHVAAQRASATVDCPVCLTTVSDTGLSMHLIRAHRASARQSPQCPDCDKPLKTPAASIAHRTNIHGYDHQAALLASVAASPKRKRGR